MSNGKIAVSGFEALADLDSNKDGIIDAQDEAFTRLRIWADRDGDGVFGDDEFYTLDEVGIESIDLRYAETRSTDENGNQIVRTGKVTWKGGDTSPVSEFLLDRNTVQSAIYDVVEESAEVAELPDLPGRGYLYSLHQAMMRDGSGELQGWVEEFAKEADPQVRRSLLDRIMLKWSAVSDLHVSDRDDWAGFLDKFYGGLSPRNPNQRSRKNMESAYEAVSLYLYGKLLQQTHYAGLSDKLDYGMDDAGNISVYIGTVLEDIAKSYATDPERAKQSIAELFLVLRGTPFLDSNLYDYIGEANLESYEKLLSTYGAELVDACRASYLAMQGDYIGEYALPYFAPADGSPVEGDVGNNVLVGNERNNVLTDTDGSDILMGGGGDDKVAGGEDSDVYIWNLGDGNDTIVNSTSGSEVDILRLGEGVHPRNVKVERYGNTVRLIIGESGEIITLGTDTSIYEHFIEQGGDAIEQGLVPGLSFISAEYGDPMNPDLQIAQIEFSDGTVWNREYIHSLLMEFKGTDEGETVEGSTGKDHLTGGKGDDILRGNYGSDIYEWTLGDGDDRIEDERYRQDINILRIKGVSPQEVKLVRDGDDLLLVMTGSGEKVTLPKWYNQYRQDQYRLHRIEFEDGSIWTPDQMETLEVESTALVGTDGDDVIDGTGRDDVLEGRKGNDILRGGGGSDTYIWNLGDGNDTILDPVRGSETNVLRFGEGITAETLIFRRDGEDIRIIVGDIETGEVITVSKWDSVENHRLARIEFANGTRLTAEEIDAILGDYVLGTDGEDVLRGSGRHRTLVGGKGDDVLYGNVGGQTYEWNLGDGNDVIENTKLIPALWRGSIGDSFLKFGSDVAPESLSLRCVDDDLVITVRETGETITVRDWYANNDSRLKSFKFADGTIWDQEKIEGMRNKEIVGTDEDDTLVGFMSDDIVVGGKGNDVLRGEGGDDVYVWNIGDGNDVISDFFGDNTLRFGAGIAPEDIEVTRNGNDLVIGIGEEKITLSSWFFNHQRGLSKVKFEDGTEWNVEDLESSLDKNIVGTDGDDILEGYDWDDVIIGGRGDDILRGVGGNDTYVWNLGDGNDTIEDTLADGGKTNRLQLGEGIDAGNVHLRRSEDDLVITMRGSGETITLKRWFHSTRSFEIAFFDGEVWGPEEIDQNVDRWIIGTDESESLTGTPGDDFVDGRKGDDTLSGGYGNDTYLWNIGNGNDRIEDGYGSNVLQLGEGVTPGKIKVSRNGSNLVLSIEDSGESITLSNWFTSRACTIKFADGTEWDTTDIGMRVNKTYVGTDGNDVIQGYEMDEVFEGGKGDDRLTGNGGEDLYLWNLGDGNDTIYDSSAGHGTLRFGEGVSPENIKIRSNYDSLVFVVGETGETITISNWRAHSTYALARVEFADGTVWKGEELDVDTIEGTDGNDVLNGYSNRNETLIGGKGNDTLQGSGGSDTYIWNPGDGNDTILDRADTNEINVLRFGEGVDPANIEINSNGQDLFLTVGETGETLKIQNWKTDSRYMLYRLEFADGTVWNGEDIDVNVVKGTDGNDTLNGTDRDETFIGGKGDDTLMGGRGDDTYIWEAGDGNDIINDETGINVLEIGEGVDPEKIKFFRYGSDMVFEISETGERLTVEKWYDGRRYQLYQVKFADGTVWSKDDIAEKTAGIFGTEDGEHLIGTDGDDRFFGFEGDDTLEGGKGDDTYEWNAGDGNDTIRDAEGKTRIKFGRDIVPEDIAIGRTEGNFVLYCLKTHEKLLFEGASPYEILFDDGTIWTQEKMENQPRKLYLGTDGDDSMGTGYYPQEDESVFVGEKGDDFIQGSTAGDTYVWNLGDGNDVIDVFNYGGNYDVLKFGEGVLPDEVHVSRTGDYGSDLCFVVEKTGERITFKYWGENRGNPNSSDELSAVQFFDGTVWARDQINAMQLTYKGTDGDDTVIAYDDDDLVIGGKGNDTLDGNEGKDSYIWNLGDGNDAIKDSHNDGVLRFGEGIDPAKVTVSLRGSDVALTVGESGESILLKSYLTEIVFADGTVWSWDDVLSIVGPSEIRGTDGDDALEGTILDDVIVGAKGNDVLRGGDGNDTYVWDLGDGSDTIEDNSGYNTLKFGTNVDPGSVTTSIEGTSLVFMIAGGERIIVNGWCDDVKNQLGEVRFADGTIWSLNDVRDRTDPVIIEGSDEADMNLTGTTMNDVITGKAGDDSLDGRAGNDVYIWEYGDGNDKISDKEGNNVLRFGSGIHLENLRVIPDYYVQMTYSATSLAAKDGIRLIVGETGEEITIENWHEIYANKSFKVQFEDGSILTADDLKAMMEPLRGIGTGAKTTIIGLEYDDVIEGGKGNPTLSGGGGNDTYIWNLGDGNHTISDDQGINVLQFGEGIQISDISFGHENNYLQIFVGDKENAARILVYGWLNTNAGSIYPLQEIRFADGTSLTSEQINQIEIDESLIRGTAKDEYLLGGDADETLIGGHGDDSLAGAGGNDTYVWNIGDGNDTINDTRGANVLQFGEDVQVSDVSFARNGDTLSIIIGEEENAASIQVTNWFNKSANDPYPLREIRFADGTVLTAEQFGERDTDPSVIRGTAGNDYLTGLSTGNVNLIGEAGDDTLNGRGDNNSFIGGPGTDTLNGSGSNNTFIWNIGDGDDTISYSIGSRTGNHVLQFGEGITPSDIKAYRAGDMYGDSLLLVADVPGGGSVTIDGWFEDIERYRFGEIHFNDGSVWTYQTVQEILSGSGDASENDDLIFGTPGDDDLFGYEGNDTIRGNDGNDTITGGKGYDTLYGEGGDDTYIWTVGDGNDTIEDVQGENVLYIADIGSLDTVKIKIGGSNLILSIGNEHITVKNWQDGPQNQLKEIRFGEVAIWSREYINSVLSEVVGTEGHDILEGHDNRDDTMIGRGGDDILMGRGANDMYVWNVGDGNDVISDNQGLNVLKFGEGVSRESVRIERDENHLYFVVGDERIQVEDWFKKKGDSQLSEVRFSDGTSWTRTQINERVGRIVGTAGEDSLQGYDNTDDTIVGGKGNDILYGGGGGKDTFIWDVGDGNDTILGASSRNSLRLGEGINRNSLRFERDEEHLYIVVGSERIMVEGWYQKGTKLGGISFADGTRMTATEIDQRVNYVEGTEGDDVLRGYNNGNEIIEGHEGNDELYGGGGNDTYIWNIGDGNDVLSDSQGVDVLKFGPGVDSRMVGFERDTEHLYVLVGDERIKLNNWFGTSNRSTVRTFLFEDGSRWSETKINERALRIEGTDVGEKLQGYDTGDTLIGNKGNDELRGGRGDDSYVWNIGDGNDRIIDSEGKNVLVFGDDIYSNFVNVKKDGDHLCFVIGNEEIAVENWFSDPANSQLKEVRFFDGVVWDKDKIHAQLGVTEEHENGIVVRGTSSDDNLQGTSGNDKILGGGGNDRIEGNKGDDKLYGEDGDDTYVWNVGDGRDTILDSQGYNDLEFGEGITPEDVEVTRDERHLYITHKESEERIKVESWYAGFTNKLRAIRFQDGTIWDANYIDALLVPIEGTEGSDSILGYGTDDVILGHGGDDIISGRGGDDVLIGGAGNDKLYGGAGDDVFVWEPGHGSDRISDGEGIDTLRFGEGVSAEKIRITRDADNLYLHMGEGETICIEDWFRDEKNRLGKVEFADGTEWSTDEVEALIADTVTATEGDDVLEGTAGDDVLDGLGGNDELRGGPGNDLLVGGEGNDKLYGEEGDDTYHWNVGDGNDTIEDPAGLNRLEFGSGIAWTMVKVVPYGTDLLFKIGEESIRITGWFENESHRLQAVVFEDGVVWSQEEIKAKVAELEGTPENDTLYGTGANELIRGGTGDDKLYGREGDDSFIGGLGNDLLDGGAGDDSYIWKPGDGDDTITDSRGTNVLDIGEGIDPEKIELQRSDRGFVLILETGERLTVSSGQIGEVRFADGTVWTQADIDRMPSIFRGTEKNDVLYGSNSADIIEAYGGDDAIHALGGNDTLTGGEGNDYIEGGAGDDTYIWSPGDGNDTIEDNSGANVLKIGEGINPSDVTLERAGLHDMNLVFVMTQTGERITVVNWYAESSYQIAKIEFADGTVWTRLDVMNMTPTVQGTDQSEYLYGTYIDDTLMGYGGNDHLYGYAGKDVLVGGTGDDAIYGGAGDDLYIWNPGDGDDSILDGEGINVLKLGDGVDPNKVELSRVGSTLMFALTETQEKLTVYKWFDGEQFQFAEVRFADGTVWTNEDINAMRHTVRGSDLNDTLLAGSASNDHIYGEGGFDSLYGQGGDDILEGGKDHDFLDGGAGDDVYVWNKGDGNDTIHDKMGLNVLEIGEGVDPEGIEASFTGSEEMDLLLTIGETGETITILNWRGSRDAQLAEIRFGDGTVWTTDELKTRFPLIDDRNADDEIRGTVGNDTLHGWGGNDRIYGGNGDDVLNGDDGNDTLYGEAGNDRLIGGSGNDSLNGGAGNDAYEWNPGDGNDTVIDNTGTNVLEIGVGVDPSQISISRNNRDLYLIIDETGEKLTIQDWYYNTRNQLAEIRFADGTVWRANDVNAMSPILEAPAEGGTITGFNTNDILVGSSGNDTLNGNAGNDTLEGREGADAMNGGAGDDTYIWDLGDGNDTLADNSGSNVLKVGGGVDPEKATISRSARDLYIQIEETGERITIKDWYYISSNQFAKIEFEDGTVWTKAQINAMMPILKGTEGNDTLSGFDNTGDQLFGETGDDTLNGLGGDDVLKGGKGEDALMGGNGNDTYFWSLGDGNDTITDNAGINALEIGEGVDPSKIVIGRNNQDVYFQIAETREKITIKDWYYNTRNQLNEIRFSDGTVWTAQDVNAKAPILMAPEEGGTVVGFVTGDILEGGAGNDTLRGEGGSDRLTGRGGDDTLTGGTGSDTYVYNRGDGNDVINNDASDYAATQDRLQFGSDLAPGDFEVLRDRNDLKFVLKDGTGSILVKDWFNTNNRYKLDEVGFEDGTVWNAQDIESLAVARGTDGNDTIGAHGSAYGNFNGDDRLEGKGGNDRLNGGTGNDVLVGGAGDDALEGGLGSDTYLYNDGDGHDTIVNNVTDYAAADDQLQFGPGLKLEDFDLRREGYDLLFVKKDGSGSVKIQDWFYNASRKLDRISFDDGKTLSVQEVEALVKTHGTSGNDTLGNSSYFNTNDRFYGGDGNDRIYAYGGSDELYGEEGNDSLYGQDGDDLLAGGTGDDALEGGTGSDTYLYNDGDGHDTITNSATDSAASYDKLQFGPGLKLADFELLREGYDILFKKKDGTGSVKLRDWFYNANRKLDEIVFEDGTSLDVEAVETLVEVRGTGGNDTMGNSSYFNTNDRFYGGDGNDRIYAYGGNDVLHGEGGNDSLYGQDGSDTLMGGAGNDTLEGGTGSDTYVYRSGDGHDTLNNYASTGASDYDKLSFEEGIYAEDITLSRSGNNLILTLNDGSGSIQIQSWYASDSRYKLDEITFADGVVWKASNGMSVEDWFQEQKELASAASMLSNQPSNLNESEMRLFKDYSGGFIPTTADLNAVSAIGYDQVVTDIALASLQMEEDAGMVSPVEGIDHIMREDNLLANAVTSDISKKPFNSNK
jgi:Ca2+-binding RTX toxin-like protein